MNGTRAQNSWYLIFSSTENGMQIGNLLHKEIFTRSSTNIQEVNRKKLLKSIEKIVLMNLKQHRQVLVFFIRLAFSKTLLTGPRTAKAIDT